MLTKLIYLSNMAEHNELGKQGEMLAVNHLKKEGYRILETNKRYGKDELDIIAEKDGVIIVAEVKTRVNKFFGNPEEFVTPAKQKRIINATHHYLLDKDIDAEVRFDVFAVVVNKKYTEINHIQDAFFPSP